MPTRGSGGSHAVLFWFMVRASLHARCSPGLGLRPSTEAILLGQLALSGDIFDCHNAGEIADYWQQASGGHLAGDAARNPVRQGAAPHCEGLSRPRRQSCGGEGLIYSESLKEGVCTALAVLVVTYPGDASRPPSLEVPCVRHHEPLSPEILPVGFPVPALLVLLHLSTPPYLLHTLPPKPVVPWSCVALHEEKRAAAHTDTHALPTIPRTHTEETKTNVMKGGEELGMLASPTPLETPRWIPGHAWGPLPTPQTLPSPRPPSCSPLPLPHS